MAKLELSDTVSGYNLSVLNDNFQKIETELKDKVVYRDEVSPMERTLDMNGNKIINLGTAVHSGEAVPLNQLISLIDVIDAAEIDPFIRSELIDISGAGMVGSDDGASGTKWTTVEGFVEKTSSSSGSSVVGHLPTGAGSIPTTVQEQLRLIQDFTINVKNAPYYAKGDGVTDDGPAINAAIAYAKSLSAPGGGTYRAVIELPAGFYYTTVPINLTKINGICLRGVGSRYVNTGIIGNTSGIIIDAVGSSSCLIENLSILSLAGFGATRSTIGVLLALAEDGGLNCRVSNCYISLDDFPTANSGVGSIGIANSRSEECAYDNCIVKANAPLIFTANPDLTTTGYLSFVISSPNATVTPGYGSMGVAKMAAASIVAYEKRQAAITLNATNSINFDGYISRVGSGLGDVEYAIMSSNQCSNLRFNGTIENFSTAFKNINSSVLNSSIDLVIANITNNTFPVFDFTGTSTILGGHYCASIPNISERNRMIAYTAPVAGGDVAVSTYVNNVVFCAPDTVDNNYMMSSNLRKNCTNVVLNSSSQPTKMGSGKNVANFTQKVAAGQIGSPAQCTVMRFSTADKLTTTSGNGGVYAVKIRGIVQVGAYGSGTHTSQSFDATVILSQAQNGGHGPIVPSVTLGAKSAVDVSNADITGVTVNISITGTIGSVLVLPATAGTGVGEPIYVTAEVEIFSDFAVNSSILFA